MILLKRVAAAACALSFIMALCLSLNGDVIRPMGMGTNGQYTIAVTGDQIANPGLKRQMVVSGTSDASGNVTLSYGMTFDQVPSIQPVLIGNTSEQMFRLVSRTTTGCVVNVFQRSAVLTVALSTATTPVSGVTCEVLVTEK